MRTTYLFRAAAALLGASVPMFADGECLTWKQTAHGQVNVVQACVAPGTDAAGYGFSFAEEDPIGNTGEPGILYASPKGDLAFIPAWSCPDCSVSDAVEEIHDNAAMDGD
jgi:hypothetical protein